jgi:hypothetical protein
MYLSCFLLRALVVALLALRQVHHTEMQPGLAEADPMVNQPHHATNGSASENGRLVIAD